MDPYLEENLAKYGLKIWDVSIGEKLIETVPGIIVLLCKWMSNRKIDQGPGRIKIRDPRNGNELLVYYMVEGMEINFGIRDDFTAFGQSEICGD